MTLFEVLFLAHLVGDFLLQNGWMAANKAKKWLPLLVHCTVYTLVLVIAAKFFSPGPSLSLPAIALIFFGHIILDRRTFVAWWVRHIQTAKGQEAGWLSIVTDQILHLLIIAGAIALL